VFNENCSVCQSSVVGDIPKLDNISNLVEVGDGAPSTPLSQVVMTVGKSEFSDEGQWTLVVNKKKKEKQGFPMKGAFWNIRGLNQPGRNLSLGILPGRIV
jgi:hypothetical protein